MNKRSLIIGIIGVFIGAIFIISGFGVEIPRESVYGATTYVGGDAYNYIIEASIRGGVIAGAMIQKTIYIATGAIITLISTFKLFND